MLDTLESPAMALGRPLGLLSADGLPSERGGYQFRNDSQACLAVGPGSEKRDESEFAWFRVARSEGDEAGLPDELLRFS